MSAAVIPVSVLTGFLGSGKTTMLRHLLRQPDFSRTAVIINEFGEIALDHELIEASEVSLIELTTEGLCCKNGTDFAETLHDLLQRPVRRRCRIGCNGGRRAVARRSTASSSRRAGLPIRPRSCRR